MSILLLILLLALLLSPVLLAISRLLPYLPRRKRRAGFRLPHYEREGEGQYTSFDATECVGSDGRWLRFRVKTGRMRKQ